MKFNNSLEYQRDSKAFKREEPKKVIPGQAYNIEQVMARIRAGLPVSVLKSGYNPDGFPKYDDLTDIDSFRKAVKEKENVINAKIKAAKDQKEAAEQSEKAD